MRWPWRPRAQEVHSGLDGEEYRVLVILRDAVLHANVQFRAKPSDRLVANVAAAMRAEIEKRVRITPYTVFLPHGRMAMG